MTTFVDVGRFQIEALRAFNPAFRSAFEGYVLSSSHVAKIWNVGAASEIVRYSLLLPETRETSRRAFCDFSASPALGGPLLYVGWEQKPESPNATAPLMAAEDYPRTRSVSQDEYDKLSETAFLAPGAFLSQPELREQNVRRFESASLAYQRFVEFQADAVAGPFPPFFISRGGTLQYRRFGSGQAGCRSHHQSECFDTRCEEKGGWCAAACLQMVLEFFRYEVSQGELAAFLGAVPALGLPLGEEFRVVEALDRYSQAALKTRMNPVVRRFSRWVTPCIERNNPLVLFNIGHSRVVVGFWRIALLNFVFLDMMQVWDPLLTNDPGPSWQAFGGLEQRVLFDTRLG